MNPSGAPPGNGRGRPTTGGPNTSAITTTATSAIVADLADELAVRLAAALRLHSRRRELRELARAEVTADRRRGLAARHATKIRRRGGCRG